jgi:hypothetical protein
VSVAECSRPAKIKADQIPLRFLFGAKVILFSYDRHLYKANSKCFRTLVRTAAPRFGKAVKDGPECARERRRRPTNDDDDGGLRSPNIDRSRKSSAGYETDTTRSVLQM